MVMKKKGQAALLGVMIGVMIFMLAMLFINPITDVITEARGVSQLDCANNSISDGQKATCLVVDVTLPYFIVACLAVAGAWVSTKIIG